MLRNLNALLPSGNRALGTPFVGVLAEDILTQTSAGDYGAGIFLNDQIVPGARYRALITSRSFPTGSFQLLENGSGQFSAPGSAAVSVFENNLQIGAAQLQGQIGTALQNLLAAPCVQGATSSAGVVDVSPGADGLGQQWLVGRPRVWKVPFNPNAKTQSFSEKSPLETIWLVADFSKLIPTVTNPLVLLSRVSGAADSNPEALRDGAPSVVDGAAVRQRVTGGVAGCNYNVTFLADGPDGARLALSALLPVRGP